MHLSNVRPATGSSTRRTDHRGCLTGMKVDAASRCETGQTLSLVVATLPRRALERPSPLECYTHTQTGFPVIRLGGAPITVDDVRALDDEE